MYYNATPNRKQAGKSYDENRVNLQSLYRILPVTGKNSSYYKITLLSSQDFPACSLFYPVWSCNEVRWARWVR